MEVPKPDNFFAAAKKGGDTEFSFIVPAKARPVLIVSAAYDSRLNEVLALRLVRFGKLSGDEQAAVRSQDDPALFHLPQDRFDLSGLVMDRIEKLAAKQRGA